MKKSLFFALFLLVYCCSASAQSLTMRHMVQFPSVTNAQGVVGTSDCWGWTDSLGVDYAIVGNSDHIAFVRASDGVVLDTVHAAKLNAPYYWRDMKTKGNYCYATSEMQGVNQGVMIIDLSPLPDSVHFVKSFTGGGTLIRSHNLDRDEGTPYLYIEGDINDGVELVNIADPENPFIEGFISAPGVHDMNGRNDTVWVAEGTSKAYSVWNVSNKSNPVQLGRVFDSNFGYCHNIWPSDDGRFFFTTEETPTKTIKVWDASNMSNIVRRGQYIGSNGLAHNVHVMGNYLFVSHYTTGVTVVDWSDPDNPVEVARFDTYLTDDNPDYHGCWGAFPYTAGNYVYASNMEGQLYILDWNPTVSVENSQPREKGKAWPNPFSSTTNIPLLLDGPTEVSVTVLDLKGSKLAEVFSGMLPSGRFTLPWHPDPTFTAGTYLIRVEAGNDIRTEKVQFIR